MHIWEAHVRYGKQVPHLRNPLATFELGTVDTLLSHGTQSPWDSPTPPPPIRQTTDSKTPFQCPRLDLPLVVVHLRSCLLGLLSVQRRLPPTHMQTSHQVTGRHCATSCLWKGSTSPGIPCGLRLQLHRRTVP